MREERSVCLTGVTESVTFEVTEFSDVTDCKSRISKADRPECKLICDTRRGPVSISHSPNVVNT